MRDDEKIAEYYAKFNFDPYEPPPPILRSSRVPDFIGPKDRDTALQKLIELRRCNGQKDPATGIRAKLRLRSQVSIDRENTTFTLNERRSAFEDALKSCDPVGVANAVIDLHPDQPFDINVSREDVKASFTKRSSSTKGQVAPSRWLQIATKKGQKDYVILLASRQQPAKPSQRSVEESLKIALEQKSQGIVKELLRYGADPNTCANEFQRLVGHEGANIELTEILMSSEQHPLCLSEKNKALIKATEILSLNMISQLLAFGADSNCSSGICFTRAAKSRDLRLLTLLISGSGDIRPESLQDASDHICRDTELSPEDRVVFLELLLSAGCEIKPPLRSDILSSSVRLHDTKMLLLLAHHREISPDEATRAMKLLLQPPTSSEDDARYTSSILFDAGARGGQLGSILLWAVQYDYRRLIEFLVDQRITLDHEDACVVRHALRQRDIPLLHLLLIGNGSKSRTSTHTPFILAKALPDALRITTRKNRHQAVELLLSKGVSGQELDQALEDAVVRPEIRHFNLVKALLSAGADVNYHGAQSVKAALELPDIQILDHICQNSRIREESFSALLPIAIEFSREDQTRVRILLRDHTHFRNTISKALVEEVRASGRQQDEITRILLDHGANVNYECGKSLGDLVSHTATAQSMALLRDALSRDPNQTALNTAFNAARQLQCPLDHRLALFCLILETGYRGESRHIALRESITSNPTDTSIPDLLLRHGAVVDYDNGGALVSAVQSRNLQLLNNLLSYNPTSDSINKAFQNACRETYDVSLRIEQLKCLKNTGKVSCDSISGGLAHEVIRGPSDPQMLAFLGIHQDSLRYEALSHLVHNQNITVIKLLFDLQIPSQNLRSRALQSCMEFDKPIRFALARLLMCNSIERGIWTNVLHRSILDRDYDLLRFMLGNSDGQTLLAGEALALAADCLDPISIEMFLEKMPSSASKDNAFKRMLDSRRMTSTGDSRRAATLILHKGISQRLKDLALIQSLERCDSDRFEFAKSLVQRGANVNAESCICFSLTGQFADLNVFRYLLTCNPNFDLVVSSLVYSFPGQYRRLVDILQIALTSDFYHGDNPTVDLIIQAMHRYPHGTELVRLLLNHNYPAGQHVQLHNGSDSTTEIGTPLIWALMQPRPGVGDDVILELLKEEQKARPGFVTSGTEVSAINLAAQAGRYTIIERLIELNVQVSAKDRNGKSPVFYASVSGDKRSVGMLLEANAQENDGSLHEAARRCQSGIVAMLIKNGHDPNYASELHGGRTPLGELCLRGTVDSRLLESQAFDTIQVLIRFKADIEMRMEKKTALHLALENDRPTEITSVLLRFPEVYKEISTDSEAFLYEDAMSISMSPDNYVAIYCNHSDYLKGQLISLLREKHCKDKWYKKRGPQVESPRGLPQAMREEQERQDLADQIQLRAIERRRKDAEAEIEIANMRTAASIQQAKDQNMAALANERLLHSQLMDRENELSTQRRANAALEHSARKAHTIDMANVEYKATRDLITLKSRATDREYESERQMISDRDRADKTIHDRVMMRIQRNEEASRRIAASNQRLAIKETPWDEPD